jgi:hypothetical protein
MSKMKNIVVAGFVLTVSWGLVSCKKCATCTYQDSDRGVLKSEEVCQKGKQYRRTLEMYDKNGWSCEQN